MCGRIDCHVNVDKLIAKYKIQEVRVQLKPSYNISVGGPAPTVLDRGEGRTLSAYTWGLDPLRPKDDKKVKKQFWVKAEELATNSYYKFVLQQRCVFAANGFYEWHGPKQRRIPFYFKPIDEEFFTIAGIWNEVMMPDKDAPSLTDAVITVDANALMAPIHHRMPVIISKADEAAWLDPSIDTRDLLHLLKPFPEELMESYQVSTCVNNTRYDTPDCIQPSTDAPPVQGELALNPG